MNLSTISAVEIGKSYRAVLDENGEPALELIRTRGMPRALSGDQIIAARALRKLGKTYAEIGAILDVSQGAVATALGRRGQA